MAANFESGVTYGEKSWHGQESNLAADDVRRYDVVESLREGKMLWRVTKKPHGIVGDEDESWNGTPAPGAFGVYREDTHAFLGEVGNTFDTMQNEDLFKRAQQFLDAKQLRVETCGSLDEGRKVYMQFSLARGPYDIGGGDMIEPKLLFASAHNGSMANSTLWTPTRTVCANTLAVALNNNTGIIKVRHTKSQHEALDAVMQIIDVANRSFEATCIQYKELLRCKISEADLKKYVKLVLKMDDTPDAVVSKTTANQFDRIFYLALHGKGQSRSELTAWSAYNGVTEWTSHFRQKNVEARKKSVWFGASAETNKRALTLASQLAS